MTGTLFAAREVAREAVTGEPLGPTAMGEPVRLAAAGEPPFALTMTLPRGAYAQVPSGIELSMVPGARLALRHAFRARDMSVELVCAVAPSDRWLPGLEDTVFSGASAKVRSLAELSAVHADHVTGDGVPFRQSFSGYGPMNRALGVHMLGFVGVERDVLVCTIGCAAPTRDDCAPVVASVFIDAEWRDAPAPGTLLRLGLSAAAHPLLFGAFLGVFVIGIVVVVLLRRPRPRSR